MARLSKIEYHMAASMLLSSPTVCSSSYVSDLSHILTSQLLRPAYGTPVHNNAIGLNRFLPTADARPLFSFAEQSMQPRSTDNFDLPASDDALAMILS